MLRVKYLQFDDDFLTGAYLVGWLAAVELIVVCALWYRPMQACVGIPICIYLYLPTFTYQTSS